MQSLYGSIGQKVIERIRSCKVCLIGRAYQLKGEKNVNKMMTMMSKKRERKRNIGNRESECKEKKIK